jgi:hypothetical protein
MSRIYTVPYQGTITNAGGDSDLLEILPADDKPIKLRGFLLSQSSEIGDAQEEGLRISVIRMSATVTSGSGGSSVTPVPMDSADAAAGAACECNNTTVATTSGTSTVVAELAWNERNSPYEWWAPDPQFAPKAKQGEGLFVRMQTTPADDFSGCFTFWIEEE